MQHTPEDQSWHALSEEILTGMHDWRRQHPKATLREMEQEVDARLSRLRACSASSARSLSVSWLRPRVRSPKPSITVASAAGSTLLCGPSFRPTLRTRRAVASR